MLLVQLLHCRLPGMVEADMAVMESHASLAVVLSTREATISDGTEARRASNYSWFLGNSTLPNLTTSQSCRASNFTFINML
jgi:hypothetical protein